MQQLVVEANPLVCPAARVNDARDAMGVLDPSRVNAEFVEYLVERVDGGTPMLVIALQTSMDVLEGEELLADYSQSYWDCVKDNAADRARQIEQIEARAAGTFRA
jgi:hypothetical protein